MCNIAQGRAHPTIILLAESKFACNQFPLTIIMFYTFFSKQNKHKMG